MVFVDVKCIQNVKAESVLMHVFIVANFSSNIGIKLKNV